jgi:hypothetical protein
VPGRQIQLQRMSSRLWMSTTYQSGRGNCSIQRRTSMDIGESATERDSGMENLTWLYMSTTAPSLEGISYTALMKWMWLWTAGGGGGVV